MESKSNEVECTAALGWTNWSGAVTRAAYRRSWDYRDAWEYVDDFSHFLLEYFISDAHEPDLAFGQFTDEDNWHGRYWQVIVEYWFTMRQPHVDTIFLRPERYRYRVRLDRLVELQQRLLYVQRQLAAHEREPRGAATRSRSARIARRVFLQERFAYVVQDLDKKKELYTLGGTGRVVEFDWVSYDPLVPRDVQEEYDTEFGYNPFVPLIRTVRIAI